MGGMFHKPLTREEARIESEDFLWYCSIKERNCFKLVAEYIANQEPTLK